MKNNKLLKYLLIAAAVLIVFAIIGKKAGWFGKTKATQVATEIAQKRTIVEVITANGKIQPVVELKLSSEVSGEIVQLNVKEGQEVKAGDLLVKINPEILLAGIAQREAGLNTAKANFANSKARLAQTEAQYKTDELSFIRNKKLWNDKAISDAEYETALARYEMSKADVEAAKESVNSSKFSVASAEASVKESREQLAKTSIFAPMDGTISALNVKLGERVLGTIQMAGTELLRIANLDKMEVLVDVNENDIIKVTNSDTAIIEVDAYLGKKFKGIVYEIANSASVSGSGTDQVTNFAIKILILKESYSSLIPKDNPNYYPFRPGMSATADIQTNTKTNVLSVPIQSITTRIDSTGVVAEKKDEAMENENEPNEENQSSKDKNDKDGAKEAKPIEVVFVFNKGKALMKTVKTGIQDDNYIEIISGITDSIEVITSPYSVISKKLKNDMPVEKVDKDKLFSGENEK